MLAEPDHATAWHSGQCGVAKVLHLEHDAHVGRNVEAFAVRQCEQLAVVEDGVEVLDPLGVDVAVEDDPLALVEFAADVVDDLAEDVGEEAVGPFSGVGVHWAVECVLEGQNGKGFITMVKLVKGKEVMVKIYGQIGKVKINGALGVVKINDLIVLVK